MLPDGKSPFCDWDTETRLDWHNSHNSAEPSEIIILCQLKTQRGLNNQSLVTKSFACHGPFLVLSDPSCLNILIFINDSLNTDTKYNPMQTEKLLATRNTRRHCRRTSAIKAFLLRPEEREKFQSCQLSHFSQNERTWQKKKKVSVASPLLLPYWSKSICYLEFFLLASFLTSLMHL